MKNIAAVVVLACCAAASATTADPPRPGPSSGQATAEIAFPPAVRLFDLHDPALMSAWPGFLATTPMLNDEPLPMSLQERLANVVATYRSLTPVDRPAFFVATYFDVLSDRLLAAGAGKQGEILPLRVCPVFANGTGASVSSLLAVASGLPDELFVNAPGEAERYRYLFLQTEFSHCRFLAAMNAAAAGRAPIAKRTGASTTVTLPFSVDLRNYTAVLGSKEELRALVETVGEVDAIARFRQQVPGGLVRDEADVLGFIRLLSLLATHGKSGYAAIPVLYPRLNGSNDNLHDDAPASLRIADALDLAYRARDAFRRIVPFAIRDTDELLNAKLAVMEALAEGSDGLADERIVSLLEGFVTGADLLLVTTVAQEKMPLIVD